MVLAADIYAEQLLFRGHGLPMWIPEPSKLGEVLIGDVGYVSEGCFYRLFNVTRPQNDQVNRYGVPKTFEVLELNPLLVHTIERYMEPGFVCSRSVRKTEIKMQASAGTLVAGGGAGYEFNCNEDRGALLVLKDPAKMEKVHESPQLINYIIRHHDSWCDFALNHFQLLLKPEDIMLVRGCVKASEWAVAAFLENGSAHEVEFTLQGNSFANASFSVSVERAVSMSVEHRSGPSDVIKQRSLSNKALVASQEPRAMDQCLFLSAYKLKRRRFHAPKVIRAAADPLNENHDLPDCGSPGSLSVSTTSSGSDSEPDVQAFPNERKCKDAIEVVLDFILESSDAEVAIASDASIYNLFSDASADGDSKIDIHGLLMNAKLHVDERGVGMLVSDLAPIPTVVINAKGPGAGHASTRGLYSMFSTTHASEESPYSPSIPGIGTKGPFDGDMFGLAADELLSSTDVDWQGMSDDADHAILLGNTESSPISSFPPFSEEPLRFSQFDMVDGNHTLPNHRLPQIVRAMDSSAEDLSAFFDFTQYGSGEEMCSEAAVPDLVSSSSTNPSPESCYELEEDPARLPYGIDVAMMIHDFPEGDPEEQTCPYLVGKETRGEESALGDAWEWDMTVPR